MSSEPDQRAFFRDRNATEPGDGSRAGPHLRAGSQRRGSGGIHSAALLKDPRKSHSVLRSSSVRVKPAGTGSALVRFCWRWRWRGKVGSLADKLVGVCGGASRLEILQSCAMCATLAPQPPRSSGAETRRRKTLPSNCKTGSEGSSAPPGPPSADDRARFQQTGFHRRCALILWNFSSFPNPIFSESALMALWMQPCSPASSADTFPTVLHLSTFHIYRKKKNRV